LWCVKWKTNIVGFEISLPTVKAICNVIWVACETVIRTSHTLTARNHIATQGSIAGIGVKALQTPRHAFFTIKLIVGEVPVMAAKTFQCVVIVTVVTARLTS
jgi:hypothetical protein